MSRVSKITPEKSNELAAGGADPLASATLIASGPAVETAFLISDLNGRDILIQFGLNADGSLVQKMWMRQTGTTTFYPYNEQLLEFDNYWRDTTTGFTVNKDAPPPPPPVGG